jgi:hypothetical protein
MIDDDEADDDDDDDDEAENKALCESWKRVDERYA